MSVYFACLIKNKIPTLFQEPQIKLNRQNSLSMSNLATETEKICSQEIACSLPTYSYNRSYETLLRRKRNRSYTSIESINSSVNSDKSIQYMKNPNIPLKVYIAIIAIINWFLVTSHFVFPFFILFECVSRLATIWTNAYTFSCRLDKEDYSTAQID